MTCRNTSFILIAARANIDCRFLKKHFRKITHPRFDSMSLRIPCYLLAVLMLAACSKESPSPETFQSAARPAPEVTADTIYQNGRIYTVNDSQPWAEAVAIRDGRFIAAGSNAEVTRYAGPETTLVDLEGQFVMPGLIDTHTHPFVDGLKELGDLSFDFSDRTASLEEMQRQIAAYAEANPDREWIFGGMWPKGVFPGENAMRQDLDAILPDRPICLMDQGGHAYWCNTRALEISGVMDPDFDAPAFSIIERDENGVPSGTIRETALGHVKSFMPKPTLQMHLEAIGIVQQIFNAAGLTAHRTATGTEGGLKALSVAAEAGDLTMHWGVGLDVNYLESTYSFEERMQQIANRKQYVTEFVKTDYAKIFIDGDLNGFGILLLEPFSGTEEYGNLTIDPANASSWLQDFDKQGISVQFHAIGDGSIQVVIDAMEATAQANGGKLNTRHYPDHNGLPTVSQINRMAELNGLIGFAPYFGFTFPGIHESYDQFVGPERVKRLQPLRTALDAGAVIATGTDWASLPQIPFSIIEGMLHRRNPWVAEGESVVNDASQAISLEEAVRAYTLGGAYALLRENDLGSIEVGKYADFIVLDRNIFEIPIDDIDSTDVLQTVFNGKVVYVRGESVETDGLESGPDRVLEERELDITDH